MFNSFTETFGLNLWQESYDKMLKDGLAFGKALTLDPKATSEGGGSR